MNKIFQIDSLLNSGRAKMVLGFDTMIRGGFNKNSQYILAHVVDLQMIGGIALVTLDDINTGRFLSMFNQSYVYCSGLTSMYNIIPLGDIDNNGYQDFSPYSPGVNFVALGGEQNYIPQPCPYGGNWGNLPFTFFITNYTASGSIGDFDGDGFGDFLGTCNQGGCLNPESYEFGIFYGNATFQPQATISPGTILFFPPTWFWNSNLTYGDFNHDKKDDLVFSTQQSCPNANTCVMIYYGNDFVKNNQNITLDELIGTNNLTTIFSSNYTQQMLLPVYPSYPVGDLNNNNYSDIRITTTDIYLSQYTSIIIEGEYLTPGTMLDITDLSNVSYVAYYYNGSITSQVQNVPNNFANLGNVAGNGNNVMSFQTNSGSPSVNAPLIPTTIEGNVGSIYLICNFEGFSNTTVTIDESYNQIQGFGSDEFGAFQFGAMPLGDIDQDGFDDFYISGFSRTIFGSSPYAGGPNTYLSVGYIILGGADLCE